MSQKKVVVGIDIGADSTKVVLGSNFGCEIVRNEVGGHSTPSAISFSGKLRQIGQTANVKSKNSVIQVNRLLAGEMEDGDKFQEFYQFEFDGGLVSNLEYDGSIRSFEASAVVAMVLGKIQTSVKATMKRILSDESESVEYEYAISVGPDMQDPAKADLLDAAYAAGMDKARIVKSSLSYAYCYQRKFPEHLAAGSGNSILIIDMGKTQTSAVVVGAPPAPEGAGKEEEEEQEPQALISKPIVRSSCRHKALGAGLMDIRLWEHFQSSFPALASVKKKSSAGQRLLDGSQKLKHLLSQLPEAEVTVENVGENDADLKLKGTRQKLAELFQADASALTDLIQKVLQEADVEKLLAVEVIGGGCRIPLVKDAIMASVEDTNVASLSYSLDDTSAALGAALVGEDASNPPEAMVVNKDKRTKMREAEQTMATLDQDMQVRADTMNKIEAHVLEMRSARHGKHGSLLPSTLEAFLDDVENWIFSEEAEQASKDDVLAKLEATMEKTDELAKDYLDALQKERDAKDREMEAEAKLAQEERAGEQEGEEDDHDNRRLPKKRRMEIVMKNKAEANELFSDGNFKFAAARYTKALSHCAKFVDLSPADTEEVNGVKLSLNLNLSLAYLKLQNSDQALRVCNDALAIDDNNTKALYRRASVYYERKNWDSANKDVKKATTLAPDDKAINKLQDRIDAQIKRQKLKEKKMAKKMFG
jgi:molecular chaperone DnaK (HSP70)